MLSNIEVGDKVLITTSNWFVAPNGAEYRAVFGTLNAIMDDKSTLGITTNRNSTNWYIKVGEMLIAGCQIHYAIKTNAINEGMREGWSIDSGIVKSYKSPSIIYNADNAFND